ncbi:hypothetical protein HDU85_005024 [Gaertneriomyces sp. JEL0708]|nr:hypothetical protein HDU85_005024 [Gaertneriomyces sp. JEL0708]
MLRFLTRWSKKEPVEHGETDPAPKRTGTVKTIKSFMSLKRVRSAVSIKSTRSDAVVSTTQLSHSTVAMTEEVKVKEEVQERKRPVTAAAVKPLAPRSPPRTAIHQKSPSLAGVPGGTKTRRTSLFLSADPSHGASDHVIFSQKRPQSRRPSSQNLPSPPLTNSDSSLTSCRRSSTHTLTLFPPSKRDARRLSQVTAIPGNVGSKIETEEKSDRADSAVSVDGNENVPLKFIQQQHLEQISVPTRPKPKKRVSLLIDDQFVHPSAPVVNSSPASSSPATMTESQQHYTSRERSKQKLVRPNSSMGLPKPTRADEDDETPLFLVRHHLVAARPASAGGQRPHSVAGMPRPRPLPYRHTDPAIRHSYIPSVHTHPAHQQQQHVSSQSRPPRPSSAVYGFSTSADHYPQLLATGRNYGAQRRAVDARYI